MTNYEPDMEVNSLIRMYEGWLQGLAEKGGKGTIDNVDARALGRIADGLRTYRQRIAELETYIHTLELERREEGEIEDIEEIREARLEDWS